MLLASVISPRANTQNTNTTLLRQGPTSVLCLFLCSADIGKWMFIRMTRQGGHARALGQPSLGGGNAFMINALNVQSHLHPELTDP